MKPELQAAYHALLIRKREIEVADTSGTVKCRVCGENKEHHERMGNMRCSTCALTGYFYSVNADESSLIEAALPPIEALIAAGHGCLRYPGT